MCTSRFLLALCIGISFAAREARATNYVWAENAADPDNVYSNACHFTVDPETITPADSVFLRAEAGKGLTVTLPAGTTYESSHVPLFNAVGADSVLTYDGPGVWVQANLPADGGVKYASTGRMGFQTAGSYILQPAFGASVNGGFKFDNLKFRISRQSSGETDVDLDRGLLNIYDPNGTAFTSYAYVNGASVKRISWHFHEGSTFRGGNMLVYASSVTNEFVFDGGKDHYIYQFSPRDNNGADDTVVDRTRLRVTGADTLLTMRAFDIVENSNAGQHRYRVDVVSNATLAVLDSISQNGLCETDRFYVNSGATLRLGKDAAADFNWYNACLQGADAAIETVTPANRVIYLRGNYGVWLTNVNVNVSGGLVLTDALTYSQKGGTLSVKTSIGTASSDNATASLTFDGTEISVGTGFNVANGGASRSTVSLTNATLTVPSGADLVLGAAGSSCGNLDICTGSAVTLGRRLIVGGAGSGRVSMTGGSLEVQDLMMVWNANSTDATNVFRQTGGDVTVRGEVKMDVDVNAARPVSDLVLNGGVFSAPSVAGGSGCSAVDPAKTGVARLFANGGTIRPTAATEAFIGKLNLFAVGPKGLTVESAYDITIPQSVGNEEGTEGRLILTGSGVKTLSGTATTVSEIVVEDGTVRFAAGSRCASKLVVLNGAKVVFEEDPANIGFTGLEVGDDTSVGFLELAVGQTLAIDGDVELNRVRVVLTGDYALDTTHALLTATGEVPAASQAAWTDALIAAGAAIDRSYEFTTDTTTPGVTALRMSVAESALVITLPEGESNATENVTFGGNARLKVDVGAGADLTISGKLQKGGVNKVGMGRLELTNADNLFLSGVFAGGGILSVGSMAPLGWDAESVAGVTIMADTFEYTGDGETMPGSLVFNGTNRTAAVVLKNEGDLTVTNISTVSGAPIKRGAGMLTVTPPSGSTTTLAVWHGSSADNNHYDPGSYAPFSFAADGQAPTNGYLGFNVAEGKVVFRGDATTTVSIPYTIGIALCNSDAVSAAPALVFDGVKANLCTAHSNDRIMLGDYYKGPSQGPGAYPRLEILNGADVTATCIMAGRLNDYQNWPTTVVDHASLKLSSFCPGWSAKSFPRYLIQNSTFVSGAIDHYGHYGIELSGGSTWSGTSAGGCFAYASHLKDMSSCGWKIGDGSSVACNQFTINNEAPESQALKIEFDGGTWYTGDGARPTFHIWNALAIVFRTTGAGLTLPVGADKTVDVARAISGDGPLVKTGAGTLHFETQGTWDKAVETKTPLEDPVSLAFEGTLDVREGAVTVDSGACRAGGAYKTSEGASVDFGGNALGAATLAGAGSFANGTVSGGAIGVELTDAGTVEGHPSFTGVTFSGNVRVDFGRAEPLEGECQDLVVATFPNGAPDVSGWRSRNTGKGTRAKFRVADNGKDVLADVAPVGMLLLVR